MSKAFQPTQLQQLTAGQPTVIKADTWNAFAKHVEQSHTAELPMKPQESNTLIICKNTTGATIPAFTMVSLETPSLPSGISGLAQLYASTMTISAIPTEEDVVGITQEPIANNEAGYVLINGITPVQFQTSPYGHAYASPDGTGGETFHEDYGTVRILYSSSGSNNALVLIGSSPSAGGASGDTYSGYFKLSISEKSRQVENPDYNPEDPQSPQYITEYYSEAHHTGGRWTINGQVGAAILEGDVTGDLTNTLQDVILHYHINSGEPEDLTPTGISVELSPLLSNDALNAYWLIGQASLDEVIQQSHGVPSMILAACREEDQSVSESESESVPQ